MFVVLKTIKSLPKFSHQNTVKTCIKEPPFLEVKLAKVSTLFERAFLNRQLLGEGGG